MRPVLLAIHFALSAAPARAGDAVRAMELIREARRELDRGTDELALPLLDQAETLAEGEPAVQIELGGAFEAAGLPKRAAAVYVSAATADGRILLSAQAMMKLGAIASSIKLPSRYAHKMEAGQFESALNDAPWWPAAYWALALRAQIDGRRDVAFRRLRQFVIALTACGLDRPYRDLAIEGEQMRDQVGRVETQFLADAKMLPSDWNARVRDGSPSEIAAAFGSVDPDVWEVAGEAMRHALRLKLLRVAADGSGDHRTIQAAVDALSRSGGGGTILVSPGTYRESIVLRETSRVILRAKSPGTALVASFGAPALRVLGGSRILVDGFDFEAAGAESAVELAGAAMTTLRRIKAKGGSRHAVVARDCFDLYLWEVDARSPAAGAQFERGSRVTWTDGRASGAVGVEMYSTETEFSGVSVEGERDGLIVSGRAPGCGGIGGCPELVLRDSAVRGGAETGLTVIGSTARVARTQFSACAGVCVHARGGDVELSESGLAGPGRVGASSIQNGSLRVLTTTARGFDTGIAVSGGSRLEARDCAVSDGAVGIHAVGSPASISGCSIARHSEQGVLLTEPAPGWSVVGGEIVSSRAGLVVLGAGGAAEPSRCEAAGGLVSRVLFLGNDQGLVTGPSDGGAAGSVCVENDTFAASREVALWAVARGPRVLFTRSIASYGGLGLLDPARLVRVENSAAFGNKTADAEPAPAGALFRREEPGFVDWLDDDWRLDAASTIRGLGAFPD